MGFVPRYLNLFQLIPAKTFARKILDTILTLLLLGSMTFLLLRIAPGGPFDGERAWPPEIKASLERNYGLDQPLIVQYFHFLKSMVTFDFHHSFHYTDTPVSEIIGANAAFSLTLGGLSLLLALVLGIPLGILTSRSPGGVISKIVSIITVFGLSLPTYLLGTVLIVLFSLKLGWLPPALYENKLSLILPALTLALRPMSLLIRILGDSLNQAIRSDYIRTAWSKGASPFRVWFKHALTNAWIPALTLLGPIAANLLTGSLVTELLFQLPGLGKHFVSSILNRDYPLATALTLLYGTTLILINFGVDLVVAAIDPRIRIEEGAA